MTTMIRRIWFTMYIWYLALGWVFRVNLGDEVWVNGRRRRVVNGVLPKSWTLDNPYEEGVSRDECRKVFRPGNLLG